MTQLPPRLYNARTVRVASPNCLEVDFDLHFGVTLRRHVTLEGIPANFVSRPWKSRAIHALVVLVGGKRLVVHTEDTERAGCLLGRVYLSERVYDDPVGLTTPYGLDVEMLDVSSYFLWLRERDFDIGQVKETLNGKK